MDKYTNHIQQCVIDFDQEKVVAIFEDVEDAEIYIKAIMEMSDDFGHKLPTLGICHFDKLSDWSFFRR